VSTTPIHDVQGIKAVISALSVVKLDGCYSPRDNLSLCFDTTGEGLVDNEGQDKGWEGIDKADDIHLSDGVGIPQFVRRTVITRGPEWGALVEVVALAAKSR